MRKTRASLSPEGNKWISPGRNLLTPTRQNNENIKWIKNLLNEGKSGKEHPTEEDREDRCTGSYRQAVGLFPILVSVIMLILI